MIYFASPDVARPSGGVRAIYRCVDLLNAAGLPAAVLHVRKGFRCKWFDNTTRIVYPEVRMDEQDVLVVPEHFVHRLTTIAPGVRKAIFNQNVYRTFRSSGAAGLDVSSLVHSTDVVGVLVVSEDNERYLEYVFPDVPIARVHHWIDEALFHVDTAARRRKIAVMPRKRRDDFDQVSAILAARGVLDGWELEALEGRSEREVARSLREAVLFVSFAEAEGFGLPAAEALACGCHVIGYHGMGGRELFRAPFALAIEDGDIRGLAGAIEAFTGTYASRADTLVAQGSEAAAFIHSTYCRERATADLVRFFGPLAASVGPAVQTVVSPRDLPHEPRLRKELRRRLRPVGKRLFGARDL